MTYISLIAGAVLVVITYFSSVAIAMLMVSRTALEKHLHPQGREANAEWLFEHLYRVRISVALLRTLLRVAFFVLVLVEVVGVGSAVDISYGRLGLAFVICAALLWVFGSVLSSAIARHAPASVLSGAMPILRGVTLVCRPLTSALAFVDEAVRRLSGANLRERDEEAEAELLRSIEDTQREGALDQAAAAMLENVVEFTSTDVGEVMTPRTDIEGVEVTDELGTIRDFIVKAGHSRIPVYEDSLDNILGILYVKDLVPYLGEHAVDFALRPILRAPIIVPETKSVRELLTDFQKSEVHLAMVVDEYGGTAGLVTIEDVLEEIVGEIHDEHEPDDEVEPQLDVIDEMRAEADGRYHIDDLNEALMLDLPEDEEYDTIGGYILASLGRVPETGEGFVAEEARFTVLKASARAVERVAIERIAPADGNGERRRRDAT
jgi:putative hemolysin